MPKYPCPICGDPNAYPIWIDADPPAGCPHDANWHAGGPVTIRNVTECQHQMKKASQAAEFRRLVPDAFDQQGNMKPGQLARVLIAFGEAHPGKPLVL